LEPARAVTTTARGCDGENGRSICPRTHERKVEVLEALPKRDCERALIGRTFESLLTGIPLKGAFNLRGDCFLENAAKLTKSLESSGVLRRKAV
jgi:hypothetical protein